MRFYANTAGAVVYELPDISGTAVQLLALCQSSGWDERLALVE